MYLAEIKAVASKFAETISKILDVDVMIIDKDYNRIANTFIYVDEYMQITQYSLLGQVMNSGKILAVKDKTEYKNCIKCDDFDECKIAGLVGVPIFFENEIVGAIALLVPLNKTSPVFENLDNAIEFIKGMSDLLSSKLKNIDDYNNLNVIKKEREIILDMIDDGLVFINNNGEIIHYNHQFENYFKIDDSVLGKNIENIIEHTLIHEMMIFRKDFRYETFFYEQKNTSFYGLLSCSNIMINGVDHGALLTFKSLGKVYNVLNEITDSGVNIAFENILGNNSELLYEINKAKQLAVTEENILIQGELGLGKSTMARAIHNFSDRSKQHFVVIDCYKVSYDLLEDEIFGSENEDSITKNNIGKLRMAHKGTIFFKNIFEMPLYIQERLLNVIKTKKLHQGPYKSFNIDVRMIFDTCCDLLPLVKQQMFDEELYFRISKNTITIPPLVERKGDIKIILYDMIKKLKTKYKKPEIQFEQEVLELMYKYSWPNNVQEMEKTLQQIIYNAKNDIVTVDDVKQYQFARSIKYNFKSVENTEKKLLQQMLDEYNSKTKVAEVLGVSRATLYRKLKKFDLLN